MDSEATQEDEAAMGERAIQDKLQKKKAWWCVCTLDEVLRDAREMGIPQDELDGKKNIEVITRMFHMLGGK